MVWRPCAILALSSLAAFACDGGDLGALVDGGAIAADAGAWVPPLETTVPGPGYTAPAALRYRVFDGANGATLDEGAFWQRLRTARFVCMGETHDDFFHHSLQYLIATGLLTADPAPPALGFEQFERQFQPVLDQFAAGAIDEAQLLVQTQYQMRWGFDWQLYQPLVALGRRRGLPLLALNPAKELTGKVASNGLSSLTPAEQAQLPELDLTQMAHRQWFREQISQGHGELDAARFENLYAAQVIRDETMAETISAHLANASGNRVLGIIGRGHCVRFAIPMRAARRGVAGILAVRALENAPALIDEAVAQGLYDLLVVPQ